MTNEVGRQPWIVYQLMRTREGVSPIPAGNVIWSLTLFLVIFIVVGASYFYYVPEDIKDRSKHVEPYPRDTATGRDASLRPRAEHW